MFKSIEYKLVFFLLLLIISVALGCYCWMEGSYMLAGIPAIIIIFSVRGLVRQYRKFNENILFLLNAIENGDYSFYFTEDKMAKREREINQMLNRIKDILTKARREVIENEKFLSLIVESVTTGIIILDESGNIKSANGATRALLNMPVLTHIKQLISVDEGFPELFQGLEAGDKKQIKVSNEREEVQLSLRASVIVAQGRRLKIITLNSIGNELEAQEMESWIRLIRVMTHEIMNSIAPITSLSETLSYAFKQKQAGTGEEPLLSDTVEALETIATTSRGLISFVESYRKFTGIPKPDFKAFDMRSLINNVINLESEQLDEKGIELEFIEKVSATTVKADKSQITQVLVNLIKNAIEALQPDNRSVLRITLSEVDGKMQVEVANNGEPIPADVLAHIFIPFFTTKDTGSGIGLSVSRYIMRLHGGNLKHHYANGYTAFMMSF